jgi:hypothetical protein
MPPWYLGTLLHGVDAELAKIVSLANASAATVVIAKCCITGTVVGTEGKMDPPWAVSDVSKYMLFYILVTSVGFTTD